ncbi:LLM class flavin-dependent oxidoreductase [Dactylosporangium sp. NPDC048998]|uniref:LLM class flavin-dependent oxidoreductase n=1 Tax=Dactylosporangium sp. NPDC048998 TaxID=3363976 RepID=UPI0037143CD1
MRYGIDVCTLGEFAEPRRVVEVARAAEAAGWEALFVWDHLAFAWGVPSADPWVVLAAVAQATDRLLLGTAVTPLPRRRPAVVASAVATLDRLSNGRVVLGVGIGGVAVEYAAFGEDAGERSRAERLDEGLSVVAGLLSGDRVTHAGVHYTVDGVVLAPPPVQRPRVPIWVGGHSRAALRRAARYDGWIAAGDDESGAMTMSPEAVRESVGQLSRHRGGDGGAFAVALVGASRGPDDSVFAAYEEAGVT